MTLMSTQKLWQTSEDFASNPFSLSHASVVITAFPSHSVIGTGSLATPPGELCGTEIHHHTCRV